MFSRFVPSSWRRHGRRREAAHAPARRNPWGLRPQFETLEARNLLTVTLDPQGILHDYNVLDGKYFYLPLDTTENQNITFTAGSSDPNVQTTVLQGQTQGTVLDFHIHAADNSFDGDLVIQLFNTLTPNAVSHITSLVNSGFYSSKDFFRVLDNFVAQAGSPTNNGLGGSSLGSFDDEFNTQLTFNSPGLVAMANSGPDTQDSQFFIMQTGADHTQPTNFDPTAHEFMDFKYTIFGQLVSGFDIFQDMMGTPVQSNGANPPETSLPISPIAITSATVITDHHDAILQVFVPTSFGTNSTTLTITATNDSNEAATPRVITLTGQADTNNERPFIGSFTNTATMDENEANQTNSVSFQVPLTELNSNNTLSVQVVDSTTNAAPVNAAVNVSVDQNTKIATVTVTPHLFFAGTLNLKAYVSNDGFVQTLSGANYDSEAITVNVNGVSLDPNGLLHNYSALDGKYMYLPLNSVDTQNQSVSYTFSVSDPSIQAAVLTGTVIDLAISGKDSSNVPFTGHIRFQLFDTLAPDAVARIKSLVQSGFYNTQQFFRVIDSLIAQAGSPTNNGQGGSGLGTFDDDFTTKLTFNSPGLVAMANSGADTNDSQFFLTQTGSSHSNPTAFNPTTLESLGYDFTYTIFGQIVSGFDTFQKMMGTPVGANSNFGNEISLPASAVTITSATVVTDTQNAILQLFVPAAFATNHATVTVTGTDTGSRSSTTSFMLTGQVDTFNDKPFIDKFTNTANTNEATAVTFHLPLVALNAADTLQVSLLGQVTTDAAITGGLDPSGRSATITVTPNANFTGTLNLIVGVSSNNNGFSNATKFDSEAIAVNVGIYLVGTTLHVGGSIGSDDIRVSYSGSNVLVTLNGTTQTFNTASLTQIAVDGTAGADDAFVTGNTNSTELANLTSTGMTVTGGPLPISTTHTLVNYFYGQAADTALLHGVSGTQDTFVGTTSYAQFASQFFFIQAAGTGKTYGYSGGDDLAFLYSATDAQYIATTTYSFLSGTNYFTQATNFPRTFAIGSGAGSEQAWFYSAAGANLISSPAFTDMTTSTSLTQAQGFKTLIATASVAGTDTAWFYGTGNTTFVSTPTYAYISSGGVFNQATGFRTVIANAGASTDVAYLYDSSGNDKLGAAGKQVNMATPNETTSLNGFATVTAQSTLGTDYKSVAAIDFVLNAVGNWKDLTTSGGQTSNR